MGAYEEWHESQHRKMMRRPGGEGVVVADFGSDDPDRRFEIEDVAWAIGGKWEQQFMGHDGQEETLLPGAWLHLAGEWDFRGWDGWQVPVPRRRCHGCHVVGLDPESGSFVEPNIGCESCHGPGGWHLKTLGVGKIHAELDAQVCGQCHTRGMSVTREFFFPIGYRPGRTLADHFDEEKPTQGQNSAHWWGNGRPRERHQEYGAWRRGGHASSLDSLKEEYDGAYGPVDSECLRCHAGEAALRPRTDYQLEEVTQGVTCSVCHNAHGALDTPRIECGACHEGGAFYHEPGRNASHVPCPDSAEVDCVDCHMPKSVTIGGEFALRDHSPGIVPPEDSLLWGTPTSCANGGCHSESPVRELQTQFEAHYGRVSEPESS